MSIFNIEPLPNKEEEFNNYVYNIIKETYEFKFSKSFEEKLKIIENFDNFLSNNLIKKEFELNHMCYSTKEKALKYIESVNLVDIEHEKISNSSIIFNTKGMFNFFIPDEKTIDKFINFIGIDSIITGYLKVSEDMNNNDILIIKSFKIVKVELHGTILSS